MIYYDSILIVFDNIFSPINPNIGILICNPKRKLLMRYLKFFLYQVLEIWCVVHLNLGDEFLLEVHNLHLYFIKS